PDAILPGRDALILPGDIDFGAPQIAQLRLPGLGPAAAVAAAPSPSPAPPRDKAISPPRRATLWPSRLAAWWQAMKNYFGHSPTQGPRPQQSTVAAASPPTPPPSSQVWQAVAQDNSLVTKKFNLAGTRLANGLYQIQVQPAETLGHYRDWSEVDLAVLQKLNHLKGTQIGLGQKLVLPLSAAQITRFEQRRQSHHQVLREDFLAKYRLAGLQEYVVQAGDTLNKILAHFSLSLWPLKLLMPDEWNGQIYPGQKLLLPQLKGRP
ncbi:MAG: LysM peptidoglycan-binding domain-containing protein, partial [Bacteriovoracaceae bacterium]|nr:LysM peptidoglycan-binding domain-containing protein [Bacteriovoracaceae bacterium]